MATLPPTALRCPRCGADAGPRGAPAPWLTYRTCPSCGHSIAIAPALTAPPRYTWEVYPGLYPPQPRLRAPQVRWRRLLVPVLLAIALGTAGLVALTVGDAIASSQSASFLLTGTVEASSGAPLAGANLVLVDEAGTVSGTTGADGSFSFPGVPTGGFNLSVAQSGYQTAILLGYVSPGYTTGSQGIRVTLVPGAGSSTIALAVFPNLETMLALVGAAAVAFAVCALVAGIGAGIVRRRDRPAMALIGSLAGLGPLATLFGTGVWGAFPILLFASLAIGAVGAFAAVLSWIELLQIGDRVGNPPP